MIKTGPTPEPATQGLIEQPAVCDQVYRWIRSFDLDGAERLLPILANAGECCAIGLRAAIALNQMLHLAQIATGTQTKTSFSFLTVGQITANLHRSARVQARAGLA